MIDEKKLLKEINGMWKGYDFLPVDRFVEVIERQTKIGEWIPCSERLPDKTDIYYIVSVKSTVSDLEYTRPTLYDKEGFATRIDEEPIAWQPLPAPYEVKSDE